MSEIEKIKSEYLNKLNNCSSADTISQIKTELFGKNGIITKQFKLIASKSENEKKKFASQINELKNFLQEKLNQVSKNIEINEINKKLENDKIDVTLPERSFKKGKIHPVSQVIDEISSIFSEIGFSVAEGPDVENEYNNFTALNTPPNHPARDMHDTFYLSDDKNLLLRTHTSPVQIRTMIEGKPPFKIIAPGRTYRCDSDQTHTPMFHQL